MSFEYLASPYSSPNAKIMENRHWDAKRVCARLMSEGRIVFSPIAHSCSVENLIPLHQRFNHDFWMAQDIPLLRHSSKLVVLMLDGWRESKGVLEEIRVAKECRIPVEYINGF